MKYRKLQTGFTVIELILVIAILSLVFALISFNWVASLPKQNLNSAVEVLVADLKQQQLEAMVGIDSGGGGLMNHGIYFNTNEYITYEGSSYNVSNSSNIQFSLPQGITVSTSDITSDDLVFAHTSGEPTTIGVNPQIIITNQANNIQKTIQLNQLGVVVSIN